VRRGRTFFGACVREAAHGTVKRATAWYWAIAVPIVALGIYLCRDDVPPRPFADFWSGLDEGSTLLAFAALTVAVSWLLFFVLRLIGAPRRLYAVAQAEIRALSAEVEERKAAQESDIALVFTQEAPAPAARDVADDAPAAPQYSVAVNNVGDNIVQNCQISVQVYGDTWLAPGRRLVPLPIPVSEAFPLRPGESRSVAFMRALPESPGAALVIERHQGPSNPELAPGSYTIKVMAQSADTRPAQLHLRLTHQHGRWTLRRAF
jgi:hypothetical protein